jgi:hypothetical protein
MEVSGQLHAPSALLRGKTLRYVRDRRLCGFQSIWSWYGKVKLCLCETKYHVMKKYWESEGTAPRILNLGSRYKLVNGQLEAPAALPLGQNLWYQLDRRIGGPQSWSERGDEEEKIPVPGKNRTPVVQPTD